MNIDRKRKIISVCGVVFGSALAVLILLVAIFAGKYSNRDNGKIKVSCVGDSITYGINLENRDETSYPAVLQELLGKGFKVENCGVSGTTAMKTEKYSYFNEKIYTKSLDNLPNIVIIMLGTNDARLLGEAETDNFSTDYRELVESYKALESQPEVFLVSPPPIVSDSEGSKNAAKLVDGLISNAVQHVAADCGATFIDVNALFKGRTEYYDSDGIHLNAKGAEALAHCVYSQIIN